MGWTVETRHKPSFQISLTWQVSTRVRGVEIQSLVQYWIKTVYCRSKDHFHWTTCTLCTPLVPKVGDIIPPPRLRRPCMFSCLSSCITKWNCHRISKCCCQILTATVSNLDHHRTFYSVKKVTFSPVSVYLFVCLSVCTRGFASLWVWDCGSYC